VIAPEIILSILLNALLFSFIGLWVETPRGDDGTMFGPSEMWQPRSFDYGHVFAISNIVGFAFQGFAIYLVIIWSRRHNKRFDQPTSQSATPAG
jgi:hypothetical protein